MGGHEVVRVEPRGGGRRGRALRKETPEREAGHPSVNQGGGSHQTPNLLEP